MWTRVDQSIMSHENDNDCMNNGACDCRDGVCVHGFPPTEPHVIANAMLVVGCTTLSNMSVCIPLPTH